MPASAAVKKYAVVTHGCRVNQADSLAIEGALRERGGVAVPAADAELLIVNTCSVTAMADQGARQIIRRIVRSNPAVQVVVTGCYATRRPDELRALPNVTHVIRNADKDTLVADLLGGDASTGDGPCGRTLVPGVAGRTAFTLRVQTGCEETCSYCIIPVTRGASRSKPLAAVLEDIERATAAGYKEIAITGVHLGYYGRDLQPPCSLQQLVDRLASWPGDVLFRISSLEPMDCTPAIVDAMAASPRLAPHFHLPLQHGADDVLRAMRRPYTAGGYRALVERIAALIPHAAIGTDLIAGFPGETEAQFVETRELVRDLPLSHLHVFPYSDRPGTDASRLPDKVDGAAIRARGAELRAIGSELARRFRAGQAGCERRALVVDDGRSAVTDNYLKVPLDEPRPRNTWTQVRL